MSIAFIGNNGFIGSHIPELASDAREATSRSRGGCGSKSAVHRAKLVLDPRNGRRSRTAV